MAAMLSHTNIHVYFKPSSRRLLVYLTLQQRLILLVTLLSPEEIDNVVMNGWGGLFALLDYKLKSVPLE